MLQASQSKQLQKQLIARARNDVVFFCNTFCWTYDPREDNPPTRLAYAPFVLFPKQAEYLLWLNDRYANKETGIAEKCRDVGFTWLNCVWITWKFIFNRGFKAGIGSNKVDSVDNQGDPDSIFEKIGMLLEWMPDWFELDYDDRFLKIINNQNGSSITGQGGDQMGRGGRNSIYFIDEAAFLERAQKKDAAVSANSNVKIKVSTPNGMGNPFATQRWSEKFPVFTFNWFDDPRKDRAWYEKQKYELDPIIFAQEVEIDYNASQEGTLIPRAWVMAAIDLDLPEIGDRVVGLDVADEGSNKNVLTRRIGNVFKEPIVWSGENTTQTAFRAMHELREFRATHINFDGDGVGAGVSATFKENPSKDFTYTIIKSGGKPTLRQWVAERRNSQEKFRNLRAEMAWLLRDRFRKTFDHVNKIKQYPLDELISIPRSSELMAQLSLPLYKFTDTGLIQIESKADMKKREIPSPDYYDSTVYCNFGKPQVAYNQARLYWSH